VLTLFIFQVALEFKE